MYWLIVTIMLLNSGQGGAFAVVREIEFVNQEKCDLAKNAYLAANHTDQSLSLVTAICVARNY